MAENFEQESILDLNPGFDNTTGQLSTQLNPEQYQNLSSTLYAETLNHGIGGSYAQGNGSGDQNCIDLNQHDR